MSEVEQEARYLTLPELSPYLTDERFDNPKELFKHAVAKITSLVDPARTYNYADIACANGEYLYYLKKCFPGWELAGFDYEPEFINVARRVPGLQGVRFEVKDLFDIEETFDIITFMGIISTIPEPEAVLSKLLDLCNPGGYVLVDGYFNTYEVEVRVVYCDNSTPRGKGKWRRNWTQHTQTGIREMLAGKCRTVEFEDVVTGVSLPQDPAKPHINSWTFKDAHGRNIITNGTNIMLNDVMMVLYK